MTITSLTIKYGAKRSHLYQTADVHAEMTVRMGENDTLADVIAAGVKALAPTVDVEADTKLRGLLEDDRALKGL